MFPLRGFTNGVHIIITRGQNSFSRACKSFPRGQAVWEMDYLPINAAKLYSLNHAPNWLNRPPYDESH